LEANFEQTVQDIVNQAATEIPAERTSEFVDALEELATTAPKMAAAGLAAVSNRMSYEQLVITMLEDIASELPPTENFEASAGSWVPSSEGFDFQIRYGNRLFLASIRYRTKPLSESVVYDLFGRVGSVHRRLSDRPEVAPLLITNMPLSKATQEVVSRLNMLPRFRYVVVRDGSDEPELRQAVREALAIDRH
jgi:hypothetical protein